jgi:hypothetical protein
MRHRIYYMLPDLDSARKVLDDLLLSRIEQRHIHFLTGGLQLPPDMPEANILQKTDIVHGAGSGMIAGGLLGMALGAVIVFYFGFEERSTEALVVTLAAIVGLLFGAWSASLVAAAIPNTRLKAFYPDLADGKILLMADVPARRVTEIEQILKERHPEMRFGGEESHMPIFP